MLIPQILLFFTLPVGEKKRSDPCLVDKRTCSGAPDSFFYHHLAIVSILSAVCHFTVTAFTLCDEWADAAVLVEVVELTILEGWAHLGRSIMTVTMFVSVRLLKKFRTDEQISAENSCVYLNLINQRTNRGINDLHPFWDSFFYCEPALVSSLKQLEFSRGKKI